MTDEIQWSFIVMCSLVIIGSVLSIWLGKGNFCLGTSVLASLAVTKGSALFAFGVILPLVFAHYGIIRLLRRVLRRPAIIYANVSRWIRITAVATSAFMAAAALHVYGYSGVLSAFAFVFAVAVFDLTFSSIYRGR